MEDRIFEMVQGDLFRTPLWLWTLPLGEHRFVPSWGKGTVTWLTQKVGATEVKLPSGFSFWSSWSFAVCTAKEERSQRDLWRALMREDSPTPLDWLVLLFNVPEPCALRVRVGKHGTIDYRLIVHDSDGPLAHASREVSLPHGQAEHHLLTIIGQGRGKGLGAQIVANAIALYRRLSVSELYLTAGLSAGGAVWGKFGYRPVDPMAWRGVKRTVRRRLAAVGANDRAAYRLRYGVSLEKTVAALLRLSDPRTLWDILDLDPDKVVQLGGSGRGLGGFLLQGTRWRAILDLQDPEAERRLRDYVETKIPGSLPPGW